MSSRDLSVERIDLWHTTVAAASRDPCRMAEYQRWMSADERARCARLRFEKDRRLYVVSRALTRSALCRYAALRPEQWRFTRNAQGRPALASGSALSGELRFNLSHSGDRLVFAVAHCDSLGVDVEDMRRVLPAALARRFFAPNEVSALRDLPEPAQARRVVELWTLKESYLKARGVGGNLPLDSFGFDLRGTAGIGFHDTARAAQAQRWSFWQLQATPHHLVALCRQAAAPSCIEIVNTELIPLVHERPLACAITRCSTHPPLPPGDS